MKKILALSFGLLLWIGGPRIVVAQPQLTNIILGHSGGAGLVSDLRRIIEREKIWEEYGLSVKAVYFNSGSVLTQAMAGGNIGAFGSDESAMVNFLVSSVADPKLIEVNIYR